MTTEEFQAIIERLTSTWKRLNPDTQKQLGNLLRGISDLVAGLHLSKDEA